MKTTNYAAKVLLIFLLTFAISCKKEQKVTSSGEKTEIDSTKFDAFFNKHPEFKEYQKDVAELYSKQQYRYIWYGKSGRSDAADVLYNRASQIEKEGVPAPLPYKEEFEKLFDDDRKKPDLDKELLISSMYFFYSNKVYGGIDPQKSKQMGWYLPREKISFADYLGEVLKEAASPNEKEELQFGQYYNLKKALQNFRSIRDKGGWGTIQMPEGSKALKKGDTGPAIAQLRKRMHLGGYLAQNTGSDIFDDELEQAVKLYQTKYNVTTDGKVSAEMVKDLNIPVEERIKTIIVNMERCRWIPAEVNDLKEYIAVNVPSYKLQYMRDGRPVLESNVVVGKEINKTVIFSGKMSYLVFSPYWNVPKSIVEEEINPALEKDPEYLERNNMEWNDGKVRQKPGEKNSLGLVKFMFPNSNNIYLHDTPAKSLFKREERAFSHGCVRVEKARDLAIKILEGDKNWNPQKIDEAMRSGTEQQYSLKRKIPVYIAYFTAWADDQGRVTFFTDIYDRDNRLAQTLYNES